MRIQNRVQIRGQVFYFRSRQLVAPRGHDRGVSHGFSTSPDDLSFVVRSFRALPEIRRSRIEQRCSSSAAERTRRAACRAECLAYAWVDSSRPNDALSSEVFNALSLASWLHFQISLPIGFVPSFASLRTASGSRR